MATEADAHAAREQYSQSLIDLGAHAIAVDTITRDGRDGFGVIVHFEREPLNPVPAALEIEREGTRESVPVEFRIGPLATLE